MLYGKYADGSIRKPRDENGRFISEKDWKKMLDDYKRGIYKASGKEYIPEEEQEGPADDDPSNSPCEHHTCPG